MMEKKNKYDIKYVSTHYKTVDWEKLKALVANSTCRSVAEYMRKVSLNQPVVLYYRNKSFDEFFDECVLLRNEMRSLRQLLPADHSAVPRILDLQQKIHQLIEKLADYVSKDQHL